MSDLIFTLFRAIESSDWDVVESLLDPNIVYRRPGQPTLIGIDRVVAYYRTSRPALTSTIIVDEVISAGDRVVAFGLVQGRSRDGSPISEQFADAFKVEHNLIRERTTYFFRIGF